MSIRTSYRHTLYAGFYGYFVQAIVNNFAPLLFLIFQSTYSISIDQIALLISINFGVQLAVDLLAAKFVDRLGYRFCLVAAHLLASAGIGGLAVLPGWFAAPYVGLLFSVVIYAIGGGLLEVLVSPVVEACPTKNKEAAMSLLHSFYCWGFMVVVLLSTAYFTLFGTKNWKWLALFWAVLPLLNAAYLTQVPINSLESGKSGGRVLGLLRSKPFWVMLLLMVCAGACEQGISQWASYFAQAGLGLNETVGNLLGPCLFALLMGGARVFYAKCSGKIQLRSVMLLSGALCIAAYLLVSLSASPVWGLVGCALGGLSVGVLWPGTFSIAAKELPRGGTALFALLALGGDLGCTGGPALVGVVSEAAGKSLNSGLLAASVFPVLLVACLLLGLKRTARKGGENRRTEPL